MKKTAINAGVLGLISVGLFSCEPSNIKESEEVKGIDIALRDTTINAANDFYKHTNGGWLANNEIPDDQSAWGSFHELYEYNEGILDFVITEATKGEIYGENSNEIKAANFYAAGMDSVGIEAQGITPLNGMLEKIDNIADKKGIQPVLAEMHVISAMAFFNEYVGIDDKQTDRYIMGLSQAGIGLPDRDYYFKTDVAGMAIIDGYKKYVAKLFVLAGSDSSAAVTIAENIFTLESKLAEVSLTRLERRDPERNYNKRTIAELQELASWLDWPLFFEAIGSPKVEEININQIDFIAALSGIVEQTELNVIKDYMKLRLMSGATSYLSSDFVNASFDFYSKQLYGQAVMKSRKKRIIRATNSHLGDALSKLYVDEVFPPEAKAKCLEMINDIKSAMHNRIDALAWMSDETKDQAHQKLTKLKVKIGYPDKWEDYSSISIEKGEYLQNHWNTSAFANKKNFNKLGQPIDPNEWHMAASAVNAYYNPPANEIVFPAGILQPPFYNYKADAAVNYGGIGAVIGHEITHGFDDSGRKYNHEGKLLDWWTEADAAEFEKRAEVMANQYDAFTVQDTLHVNGKLTLGENIADLGGMLIAYDALQEYYAKNGKPELIDGLTGEQRFFMSQATIWRGMYKPAYQQRLLVGDTHSPGVYRVNGTVSSMKEFYEAFGVKEGDALWLPEEERVNIW